MEEGKNLLCFSHGKHGNENCAASFKCLADSGEESFFKKCTILTWDSCLSTPGRFHDESVERAGRMLAREHEGLALEIEVAGVEGAMILGTDFGHDGAGHMACVVQDKFECRGVDPDRAVEIGEFPGHSTIIHPSVSVERVVGATEFAPLAGHNVHRIMEERFCQGGGS